MVSPDRAEGPASPTAAAGDAASPRPGLVAAWCAVAFASGAAALLFETLWFRAAGLTLGNGVWASSVVLSAFMAGLAIGNGLAARRADRARHPARLYAVIELTIGVSGLLLVVGLPLLTPLLAPALASLRDVPWLLNGVRLGIALLAMMTPAVAMGATLPVLVKALSRHDPRFGRVLGRLYGWNTLGAVAGALAAEGALLAWFGMRGSALVALGVNGLSAAGALALAGASTRAAVAAPPAPPERVALPGPIRALLVAAFLSGTVFLALEVVWFRFLALFVYGTSLAFAVLLAVVLVGIALGGLTAARWLRVGGRASIRVPPLALASGVAALLGYASYETVRTALLAPGTAAAQIWHIALLALPLMLPTAWISGVLFTYMGETVREALGADARAAGLLTLANTLGGACGSLLGGFWLLPRIGIETSFLLLAGAYGVVALLSVPAARGQTTGARPWMPTAALAAAWAVAFAIFPSGALRSSHLLHPTRAFAEPGARVVAVREGLLQTIVLVRTERFGRPLYHRLFTDGFSMSATTAHSRRYMKAYVYLPVALDPDLRDALLISYGVGSTAKALTDTRGLERIDVVDISPDVLATSALVFPRREEDPLEDPRVTVHVEDGRFYLQTVERRYDLITSEPPPPKYAGVVSLYSREYFELIRARLRDGGITTYWLPVHNLSESDALSIVRAFCDVFSDCTLWSGAGLDWMLVGTRDRSEPVDAAGFRRQWQDPDVLPELRALGFETPAQLGTTFLAGSETLRRWTRDVAPVVDDFPLRISHEPVQPSVSQRSALFRGTLEAGRAADEFADSDFVARLFPPELRRETLAAFPWQRIVNERLVYDAGAGSGTADLHAVLTGSPLRTLPLWLMGSGADEQRILDGIPDHAVDAWPGAARQRGIGALAERRFADAAAWLERARATDPNDLRAASLEVYALCLAGELDTALETARWLVARSPEAAESDAHWRWLTETFGLPDPRPHARAAAP